MSRNNLTDSTEGVATMSFNVDICNRISLQKSLEIPWKSLVFSWKISKESEKSNDFEEPGKGAKIQEYSDFMKV